MKSTPLKKFDDTEVSIETISELLTYIDSGDRDLWVRIGMSVKSAVGDSGFHVWDNWSANSSNYEARAAKSAWKSFSGNDGIGIGTLFHEAMKYGYVHNTDTKPTPLTEVEVAEREARRIAVAEMAVKRRQDAAASAKSIFESPTNAFGAANHDYLNTKGIQPHGVKTYRGNLVIGGMNCDGALMLPMMLNGKICSLQFINKVGEKRFLPDGEKGGYLIGKISDGMPVCICEGFATGASINEATGYPVIVAFDAGNLSKMSTALRSKNPTVKIVVCADQDESGTGQFKGIQAAQAVGGLIAMPVFPADTDKSKVTDFNDMSKLSGHAAVQAAIDAAVVPVQAVIVSGDVDVQKPMVKPSKPMGPPQPLPTMSPVLPFDYLYLPGGLHDFVKDISERMQCPPDFAAVAALVMIGTIIGRKVGMRPMKNDDWTVIPNLWGAVVGNSGVMKSPALAAALSPLHKLQAEAHLKYSTEKIERDARVEIAKVMQAVNLSKAKGLLKKDHSADVAELLQNCAEDIVLFLRRYITNNATYESLGELLIENPNGVLVVADEIVGLLKQWESGGQEVAKSFFLTAADGNQPYTFDRIMRGKDLHIEAACLSIIGGIQPGVLEEYVKQANSGGAGAEGLLQRFGLIVYPDIPPSWHEVDRPPNDKARDIVEKLVGRLDKLSSIEIGSEIDPRGGVPFQRFDAAAQPIFSGWRSELEHRLRSGEDHPAIVSHLSKYRKLIPSLALINHICDGGVGPVGEMALLRAIELGRYLETHARRIYNLGIRPDIDSGTTLLNRIASGKLNNPFTLRDVYRPCWIGLDTQAKAQAAINILIEYNHLYTSDIEAGVRTAVKYHLNCELKS